MSARQAEQPHVDPRRLIAVVRLLLDSGDMTPMGARQIIKIFGLEGIV